MVDYGGTLDLIFFVFCFSVAHFPVRFFAVFFLDFSQTIWIENCHYYCSILTLASSARKLATWLRCWCDRVTRVQDSLSSRVRNHEDEIWNYTIIFLAFFGYVCRFTIIQPKWELKISSLSLCVNFDDFFFLCKKKCKNKK